MVPCPDPDVLCCGLAPMTAGHEVGYQGLGEEADSGSEKGLCPSLRKRFKQYLRDNTTDLSKVTRQCYSSIICNVIVDVMKQNGRGVIVIEDMEQVSLNATFLDGLLNELLSTPCPLVYKDSPKRLH